MRSETAILINDLLILTFLVAANWLTGALILRQFPGFVVDRLARFMIALGLGIGLNGWLAVVSAELGFFSPLSLLLIWTIPIALLSIRLWRTDSWRGISFTESHGPTWLLLLWLPVAAVLFLRPHEYVVGGGDAGVYINLAANIERTGAILIEDATLAGLDPALHDDLLRVLPEHDSAEFNYLAGFYATDPTHGEITPQFYPFHPVWQAIAYTVGGLNSALLLTSLWALLSTLVVYLTARDQLDWRVALLALAGLTLNAMQIWFARYPTTEPITQFLLWAGIWALGNWLVGVGKPEASRDTLRVWALLAGVMLGQTLLARIDMLFILAVPFVIAFWIWLRRFRWYDSAFWWFGVPFTVFAVHGVLHGVLQSYPYFMNTYGFMVRVLLHMRAVPALALVAVIVVLLIMARFRDRLGGLARLRRPILGLITAVLIVLALYGWFIRPNLNVGTQAFSIEQENLVRLGWYFAPFGVALSVAGACHLVWKINRRTFFTVTIGLFFSLLYLWNTRNNPHQIYVMRRHVPALLPFAMIAAAAVPGWLLARRNRWRTGLAVVIVVAWLAGLIWSARGFISQRDYWGVTTQLAVLSEQLEPRSIVLVGDDQPVGYADSIGTPLHFLFGHDVFALRRPGALDWAEMMAQIEQWIDEGRAVYWLATGRGDSWPLANAVQLAPAVPWQIRFEQMEADFQGKPDEIFETIWSGTLQRVQP